MQGTLTTRDREPSSRLAVSLRSDAHAAPPEYRSSRELQIEHESAVTAAMANMDVLGDWIYGEVMHKTGVESERIERAPALLPARLDAADTAQVLHLLFNAADPAVIAAARDVLARRYLVAQELA